jgi:iron complex transport system permease protein
VSGVSVARPRSSLRARGALFSGIGGRTAGLLATIALLGFVMLLSLALGTAELDLASVIGAFTNADGSAAQLIVTELRLPRTLVGLAVGIALGLAGTLMQGLTRNPLAEPGILGVSAGASLMVVIGIASFGIADMRSYLWFSLAGAAIASIVVYGIGSAGRAGATPVRLALVGAALTALLGSITSAILVIDESTLERFRFWEVGSIAGRDMESLLTVLPILLVGVLVAFGSGRHLNALSLGDDVARSLGQRVTLVRASVATATVLLAGAAVALAGPIAFVGLAVPHAARMLVGPDYRWLVAYSLTMGPILLLVADIAGRMVARPSEVSVGIMTALLGVPVFIWLVRRSRLAAV